MPDSTTSPSPASLPGAPLSPDASLDSSILRVLMDTIPDRIYFKDLQSRFVLNNHAHLLELGVKSLAEAYGKTDFDFFSHEHAVRALADEQEVIRTGKPVSKIEQISRLDGSEAWGSTIKLPWRDASGQIIGTFGLTRDVTDTKQAEEKLTEERNLLRTIIDHLPARIYVKGTDSRYLLNNAAHLSMLGLPGQEQATGRTTFDFFPNERGRRALDDDRHVVSTGNAIVNREQSEIGLNSQLQWTLTTKVPLRDVRGSIVGIVGIGHDITRRKLAEAELQRRTDEMEADVLMARQVQETFLPRAYPVFPRDVPPESSALRFAHRYIPATTLGGDFFNIVQLSDTKCGVLVCDVMGHGVRAGLLTALIRGVVGELGERAEDPTHVLAEINHSLAPILEQSGQPVFATAFFGVIDTAAGTLVYGNAGHPAPLVRRGADGQIVHLTSTDPEPAAGLVADFIYTRQECSFLAGDLLLAYTDGVIEAPDPTTEFFGELGLIDFLRKTNGLSGEEVCQRLVETLGEFSGRKVFEDDVCVVTIEPTGTTCAVQPLTFDI